MADEEKYTGAIVALIPAEDDPITAASSEPAHVTLVYMGDDAAALDGDALLAEVGEYAAQLTPITVPVKSRGLLGDDDADVVFLEPTESLLAVRDGALEKPAIRAAHDAVEQYPEWQPHVTLGYPETPAAGDYPLDSEGTTVTFDRLGLWMAGERTDFPLQSAAPEDSERAPEEPAIIADATGVIADAEDAPPIEIDALEEVPVHGVLAPEGVPTGDGRMFREGALTTRTLPIPLRYEIIGSHGAGQSQVVTVGRVDEVWREGNDVRYRGAVLLSTRYGAEVVDGIINGTVRGVSIDGDNAEATMEAGPGGRETAIFEKIRASGLTIVPIPAYQEAYIALGHEFVEDMSEDQLTAAAQALEDCGCSESVSEVSHEGSFTDRLDVPNGGVAPDAQKTADLSGGVIVVNLEGGPRPAGAGAGASQAWDFAADRATAALLLQHGVELGLADPVLSAEGAVSATHPSFIRNLDAFRARLGPRDQAGLALGSSATSAPVEVGVRLDLPAESAGHGPLVFEGHSLDLPLRGGRSTTVQVVVPAAETTGPDGSFAIGNGANLHTSELTLFRNYSAEERRKLMEEGKAMRPDGSFPIADEEDLRNAIQSVGRASDQDAARAHIRKRAKALGAEDQLPEGFALAPGGLAAGAATAAFDEKGPESFAPVTAPRQTQDGPGWITDRQPTNQLREYWVHGPGAAKIVWGTPGAFNRCRAQLAKYVQNPDWLAGLCANMYYHATGRWPGRQRGDKGLSLQASGAAPAPAVRLVDETFPEYEEAIELERALVASAGFGAFDAEMFKEPPLDAPGMTVDKETGHVYGYIAEFGVCHIGIPGVCTEAPRSRTDYKAFKTGVLDTTEGPVRVGKLTAGVGHPNKRLNAARATAHYDKTSAIRAYVNVGENSRGIWYAGVLAPGLSARQIDEFRAIGTLSGDWREVKGGLELVAAVAVAAEGFPKVGFAVENGEQVSLVAAGALSAPEMGPEDAQITPLALRDLVSAEIRRYERITAARAALRAHRIAALKKES